MTHSPQAARANTAQATREAWHTPTREQFSFDGYGINGPDEYRSRIATFVNTDIGAQYGPYFAKACNAYNSNQALIGELVAACQVALDNLAPKYSSDHIVIRSLRAALKAGG